MSYLNGVRKALIWTVVIVHASAIFQVRWNICLEILPGSKKNDLGWVIRYQVFSIFSGLGKKQEAYLTKIRDKVVIYTWFLAISRLCHHTSKLNDEARVLHTTEIIIPL